MLLVAGYIFYGFWDWRFLGLLVDLDRRRLLGRAGCLVTTGDPRRRTQDPDHVSIVLEPRRARVLQVLRLLRHTSRRRCSRCSASSRAFRHAGDRAAGRHLVLHVPEHELHDRRLPRQMPARPISSSDFATFVPYFPQLVAGPIERAAAPAAAARCAAPLSRRATSARACASSCSACSRRSSSPTTWRRSSITSSTSPAAELTGLEVLVGMLRVRLPDLRRLLGLLLDRAGRVEVDGHRPDAQLPHAVFLAQPERVLAALAHQPVDVAARLPVHPARRQPPRPRAPTST